MLELSGEFEVFLFDIDGVLWEAEEPLPNAIEFLNKLGDLKKSVYLLTNNSLNSREVFCRKLEAQGTCVAPDHVLSAPYAVTLFLQEKYAPGATVFVVGEQGMYQEIETAGFRVIRSSDMSTAQVSSIEDLRDITIENNISVVAVGYTPKLNFYMIHYAVKCIENGAGFVSANPDKYDRLGKFNVPGCGCSLRAISSAAGIEPVIVGKPSPFLLELACKRDRLNRDKMVMLGDKMTTDILLAKNFNIKSVLVLTGSEDEESYKRFDYQPDYIVKGVSELA